MQDYNSKADQILYLLLITLATCILLGTLVVLFFARQITKPIKLMAAEVGRVANGDLTGEPLAVKNKDEIGMLIHDFNRMKSSLKEMIGQVAMNAHQVAATSEQLTASAEQTSRATEQISESIQEVSFGTERQAAQSMEATQVVSKIANGIEQIADRMKNVSASSVQAANLASDGNQVVTQSIAQMNTIQEKVQVSADVVNMLGEKSSEISQIISLITDIAAQTNLLALNAAIEAARAGEQGRGFSVVADEVRKLAEQSAFAAGQIGGLIQEIQNGTSKAVEAMGEGIQAVSDGIEMVNHAGYAFSDILQSVEEVSRQTQEVTAAVEEILSGTQTMVTSMNEILTISEHSSENAQNVAAAAEEQTASMQEISAAAHTLSKMAEELHHTISQFTIK
jgi:methyl-accepting chemotaxis protein